MQRLTPSVEPAQECAQGRGSAPVEPALRFTREFVYELKFYIACEQAGTLLRWVRARMDPDPHGAGPHADTYQVSSLYFDTTAYHVLGRKGSYARTKYRIRRYNQSETVYLERKTRGQSRVFKRRSPTRQEQLLRLQSASTCPNWEGRWFHRRLLVRSLRAVSRVDYQRIARVGRSDYGPMRLTLDQGLRAWQACEPRFEAAEGGSTLPGEQLILELKFGVAMPAVFKQLICEFGPRACGISKYRLACEQLGLAPRLPIEETEPASAAAASAGPAAAPAAMRPSTRAPAAALAPYALAGAAAGVASEPLGPGRRVL